MTKLIRFGDVIINYSQIVWIGLVATTTPETLLSFQFINSSNNFTLKYPDRNTAINGLNLFENMVKTLENTMS